MCSERTQFIVKFVSFHIKIMQNTRKSVTEAWTAPKAPKCRPAVFPPAIRGDARLIVASLGSGCRVFLYKNTDTKDGVMCGCFVAVTPLKVIFAIHTLFQTKQHRGKIRNSAKVFSSPTMPKSWSRKLSIIRELVSVSVRGFFKPCFLLIYCLF